MRRLARLTGFAWLLFATTLLAQTREEKLKNDRQRAEAAGLWIYNDLEQGFAEARKSNKPMLVVLRCVPCTECVKLDDDLIDNHPRVRPLLEQYVCVRVIMTNGLDLSLFQFDTDQSFAAFLLNADRTIYGRFGTRSHRTEWVGDVSVEGLAAALEGGLELHKQYPQVKASLRGKTGPAPEYPSPHQIPGLKEKYSATLATTGNVVQSCIHCHQIGDAQRDLVRQRGAPLPDRMLFPYPHPKSIGLILDPDQRASVKRVEPNTWAAAAGFQAGDQITSLNGQPLLSIADVQWVLEQTSPQGATINAEVRRSSSDTQKLALKLPAGWREADDIGWRVSSWGLRRMGLGGLLLESVESDELRKAGVPAAMVGLRVKHVGQFGPHAAAKQAGFRVGDVLVEYDGKSGWKRDADLLAYSVRHNQPGQRVPVVVYRDGQRVELSLPMQR